MANFSEKVLESMGFRDLIQKGELSVEFMSLTVYEARGIELPDGFVEVRKSKVAGVEYQVALSKAVNLGCLSLVGTEMTESEPEWLENFKTRGPFVLVVIRLAELVECEAGRMQRMPDGNIHTYDSFPLVREELRKLEERVLPPVISALTLALNDSEIFVTLRKLTRETLGWTLDGVMINDVRYEMSASAFQIRPLLAQQAINVLDASVKGVTKLHERAAKFFALGTAENDQLKRFLYFFLSLEVETHASFKRIEHADKLLSQLIHDGENTNHPHAVELISRDISKWNNLADKFIWCSTCAWKSISNEDIDLFKKLKKARDDIAHGNESEPPLGYAYKAELLARKILWAQH